MTGDRDGVDVAVVTVSTMRVPWQGAGTGMSGGVLFLGDVLNMAEREMRDTVLLLTESAPLPVPVDEDTLQLVPVKGEASTSTYRLDGDFTQLAVRRWDVTPICRPAGMASKSVKWCSSPLRPKASEAWRCSPWFARWGTLCWLPIRWQRRKLSVGGRRKTPV